MMRTIFDFFRGLGRGFLAFMAIAIVAALIGINFKLLMGLVILFAISYKFKGMLGTFLRVAPILVIGYCFFAAYLPLSRDKGSVVFARMDLSLSKKMGDKTATKIEYLRTVRQDQSGQKFLKLYDSLLAAGKVQEADVAWEEFQNKWEGRKPLSLNRFDVQMNREKNNSQFISDLYYKAAGTYSLNVEKGEETGWITVGNDRRYNFSSDSVELFYKNHKSVRVWEIEKLPDIDCFKLVNRGKKDVSLLVKLAV